MKKKKKIWIVVSVVIAIFICAGAGLYIWYLNSPFTTVVKMTNAVKENDMDALIECIEPETAEKLQMMIDLFGVSGNDLMEMLPQKPQSERNGEGFGNISMKFDGYSRKGDQATISFSLADESGGEHTQEINFVRLDGTWYLTLGSLMKR